MRIKLRCLPLLLAITLLSCNNRHDEAKTENIEINAETSREIKDEISVIDKDDIIRNLQGKWKEAEYPFRLAHFKESKVQFIEEGIVEEPSFQEYVISNDCPFNVNNIKNASPGDIFLVMAETRTCEILKIGSNTLTLRGFSTNTNSDYIITYKKVE